MFSQRLYLLAAVVAAVWLGSVLATGFMAVPTVFASLQPKFAAGNVAARLFAAQGWLSMVCCVLLVVLFRGTLRRDIAQAAPRPDTVWLGLVLAGLLAAMLVKFAIAPRIELRQNLALWHSVGTAVYVLQSLCALGCVWRLHARHAPTSGQ